MYYQINTLGDMISLVSRMHGHILMRLVPVTESHDTDDILKVMS